MEESKRSMNPFMLLIGVVAGAVGALALSDKKTRTKAQSAIKEVKGGSQTLAQDAIVKIKELLADAGAFTKQAKIDATPKKKTVAKSKTAKK